MTGFLLSVSSHLSRKRPADTFLDFLTNSSSIVIVFLSELSSALKASAASSDASDAVHTFLEANPSSSLSNVLDVEQQNNKLKAIAEDILYTFLEPKAYACEPVRLFLREILAGVILEMTVTSCSRPEFINEWIVYSLEEGNTEILDAIDAGVGGAAANGNVKDKDQVGSSTVSAGPIDVLSPSIAKSEAKTEHKRTVSRAEDAMEEAMQEAKRLSELIATEEATRRQSPTDFSSSEENSVAQITPTSSRDDLSAVLNEASTTESAPTSSGNDLPAAINESSRANSAESGKLSLSVSQTSEATPGFTTFDQIISSQKHTDLQASQSQPYAVPPLTLFDAGISIFDDSQPGEKGMIRSKPIAEYLLQIEPATSQHPGWMIARKYSDFETLHEVLRRISVISGVAAFSERHPTLPSWKSKTKAALRSELEHYLRAACSYQRLAESEGMKRFLEKDQGLASSSPGGNKSGFGFPTPAAFETMGKGMLDVLVSTPKGAASGGKAILGGVTGVLGGVGSIGQKKQHSHSPAPSRSSIASPPNRPRIDSNGSSRPSFASTRDSNNTPHQSMSMPRDTIKPPLPRRRSQVQYDQQSQNVVKTNGSVPEEHRLAKGTLEELPPISRSHDTEQELHLPPPPSEISDDYNVTQTSPETSLSNDESTLRTPTSTAPTTQPSPSRTSTSSFNPPEAEPAQPPKSVRRNAASPLNSQETSVAVELFFATINELYTLSSAWTLRLTLLNAAKSFLLRPGNPNLEAIRVLLQTTMIDANTSDTGIATHLIKLRENSLPTEEELKAWPPPPNDKAKERMRVKARKLLVEKGMPQALTSVMGATASGEALGRVFDCLQIPEVARGLVFALILQGVRAVTQ